MPKSERRYKINKARIKKKKEELFRSLLSEADTLMVAGTDM